MSDGKKEKWLEAGRKKKKGTNRGKPCTPKAKAVPPKTTAGLINLSQVRPYAGRPPDFEQDPSKAEKGHLNRMKRGKGIGQHMKKTPKQNPPSPAEKGLLDGMKSGQGIGEHVEANNSERPNNLRHPLFNYHWAK